jgi:hypothetical protein
MAGLIIFSRGGNSLGQGNVATSTAPPQDVVVGGVK